MHIILELVASFYMYIDLPYTYMQIYIHGTSCRKTTTTSSNKPTKTKSNKRKQLSALSTLNR